MNRTATREITEILNMPAGASLVYYSGLLSKDRGGHGRKRPGEVTVDETANIAWKLYEKGVVLLTQRRLGEDDYEYIATRTRAAVRRPTPTEQQQKD